jgi:predicted nucleotidyltransferase
MRFSAHFQTDSQQIARAMGLVHSGTMRKAEAISRLKPFERRLRERGIKALYLFGSTARDEAGEASDLDLLYEYDPSRKFSLFDQAGAMLELSDELGTKVDLVSRVGLRPRLRARIEGEMVRVF